MSDYKFSLKPKRVPLVKTKYRAIKTKIPSPQTVRLINEAGNYSLGLMAGQLPLSWHKAVDFNIFDPEGNKWIDFTSTIFVTNTGHANPHIKRVIKNQIDKDLLHAYNYPTEIKTKFLKKLIDITPEFCEKALLFSTGAEATESVIPLMRTYGQLKDKKRLGIISFKGNMHGVTMGAQMLKGNDKILSIYGFKDPNIYHLPFPYPWEETAKNYDWKKRFNTDIKNLEEQGMDKKNVCGFILEAYQGWGAVFYPKPYIQELDKFAKKNGILIMIDEIQSGFGRTGKMFAFEHYGIKPDLICVGKGISGSLPLSAVLGKKELIELSEISDTAHSTHSGNPLSCAAGLANLEEVQLKNLVKESARKGKILFDGLHSIQSKYPKLISYVLGKGLLAAVLFKDPETNKPNSEFVSRVCEKAMQKGLLLVHTGRESIKIAPPLTIPDEALIEGLRVLEESLVDCL